MTREQERRWQELASARNNNGCALCAGWDKEMTVDGCAVQRDGMSAAFIEGAIVIFERGIAIGQIKVTHCPNCGAVNDVWIKGETPPPNHAEQRNEPSTAEIVAALRYCGSEAGCAECQYTNIDKAGGCYPVLSKIAADRLEQLERENAALKSNDEAMMPLVAAYPALKSRAESAEAERDAAVMALTKYEDALFDETDVAYDRGYSDGYQDGTKGI